MGAFVQAYHSPASLTFEDWLHDNGPADNDLADQILQIATTASAGAATTPGKEQEKETVSLDRLLLTGSLDARKTFLRAWIRKVSAKDRVLTITYTLPPVPDPDDHGGSGTKKASCPISGAVRVAVSVWLH